MGGRSFLRNMWSIGSSGQYSGSNTVGFPVGQYSGQYMTDSIVQCSEGWPVQYDWEVLATAIQCAVHYTKGQYKTVGSRGEWGCIPVMSPAPTHPDISLSTSLQCIVNMCISEQGSAKHCIAFH